MEISSPAGVPRISTGSQIGRDTMVVVVVTVLVFVALGAIGAVLWHALADLPRAQRSSQGIGMSAVQSTQLIGIDAWFVFVSAPIALIAGAGLLWWHRRTPTIAVAVIAVASLCASAAMERLGKMLGPGDPVTALARAASGITAPVQLEVQATGALLVWPTAAVLGALLVLLILPQDDPQATRMATADKS